jgi:uncharacterized low-complexity protein
MKIKLFLAGLLTTFTLHAQTGAEIFEAKCAACHTKNIPEGMHNPDSKASKKMMMQMKAPPFAKVSMQLKKTFMSKDKFVAFVSDYITNPDAKKAHCNPMAVKRFGLMPPIGKSMSDEEKKTVSEWMFTTFNTKSSAKCGQGKCGSNMNASKKAMKCASGKCGGNMKAPKSTPKNMKCAPGKCGGN